MDGLHADSLPYRTGFFDTGDEHRIYFALSGAPEGHPILLLHGGPGSGLSANYRRYFNPQKYRIIQLDQRGCGLSVPNACETLDNNTTHHLVNDIEQLRQILSVERWAIHGASWGSTLALTYAQSFPDRVRGIILAGVTTTRKSEIDWLYEGLGPFLPEAWQRFIAHIPDTLSADDPVGAYYALLTDADPAVQLNAARAWHAWEAGSISFTAPGRLPERWKDDAYILTRARLCAHYFHHKAWLEDGVLLRNAPRLAGIPGFLVQGRQDLQGPPRTAYELSRAWPGSELIMVEQAGHSARDTGMAEAIILCAERLADIMALDSPSIPAH